MGKCMYTMCTALLDILMSLYCVFETGIKTVFLKWLDHTHFRKLQLVKDMADFTEQPSSALTESYKITSTT